MSWFTQGLGSDEEGGGVAVPLVVKLRTDDEATSDALVRETTCQKYVVPACSDAWNE